MTSFRESAPSANGVLPVEARRSPSSCRAGDWFAARSHPNHRHVQTTDPLVLVLTPSSPLSYPHAPAQVPGLDVKDGRGLILTSRAPTRTRGNEVKGSDNPSCRLL